MKRISGSQWQTSDVLAKPLSKTQDRLLCILLYGPSSNYLKTKLNTESHWYSNYWGDRTREEKTSLREQRGTQATAKDGALARREQLYKACKLLCFSSHVLLYSHTALTHSSHVNPHLSNCKHSFAILVQLRYWGTCWLVDTWPLCSLGQQK